MAGFNISGLYKINGKQIGKTVNHLGTYSGGDNSTVSLSSPITEFSFIHITFNGVNGTKIGMMVSAEVGTRFGAYYPNCGGIRGYVASSTTIKVEDVEGTTSFDVYGIK